MLDLIETVSDEVREHLWQQEEAAYQRLCRLQSEPASRVFTGAELSAGFAHRPTKIVCVDERVRTNDPAQVEIALLGSGALLSPTQRAGVAAKIRALGAPIDTVCYHDYCRAVARFCEIQKERDGVDLDLGTAGREAAELMLAALGQTGTTQRIGYDRSADLQMTGSPMFHHGRVIVVDGTGLINPPALGLPTAFQYSARYVPDFDLMNADLSLIQDIAISLGFGEWFRQRAPLVIFLVGDPNPNDWQWSVPLLSVKLNRALTRYPLHTRVLKLTPPADVVPAV